MTYTTIRTSTFETNSSSVHAMVFPTEYQMSEISVPIRTGEFGWYALEKLKKEQMPRIVSVIQRLLDRQLISWLDTEEAPTAEERLIAVSVAADRLCGSTTDPIIRNAQEARQLKVLSSYLEGKGYEYVDDPQIDAFSMNHGTYAFHKNVSMFRNATDDTGGMVNTPIDVVIMPMSSEIKKPVLVECKSAGDFTNTNKRRKEEDTKVTQLRATYGDDVILYLFLCGYFDSTYLGYEAANHMDWVWEHRVSDFEEIGV